MLITIFFSKYCEPSEYWETKKDAKSNAYEDFMATHDCSINHPGSLGSMKATGLVDCFK